MHNQYDLMLEDCPTPHLWRLSILGTSMHIYADDTKLFDVAPLCSQCSESQSHVLPVHFLAGQ